jgi:phage baseplate assembly protein V
MADFAELDRRLRALENNKGAILRFGEIVAVDEVAGAARVRLPDANNMVSGPLRVLQDRALDDQHQEMPDQGSQVACLFSGQGFEQGVILGTVYSSAHPSPGRPAHVWYRKFKDGTELEYDRETHRLTGDVKGWVDMTVERDVDLKVQQKLTLDVTEDVLIKSAKTLTLEGAVAIVLRTPSLAIGGIAGVCEAIMNMALSMVGKLTHQGDYDQTGSHKLSGDVDAGGRVIDQGGNTPNHNH